MKRERLLVMNGSRILQSEGDGGTWQNNKVSPSTDLKPGFYNLFAAKNADANGEYRGQVVHADRDRVFQQCGKELVAHPASVFEGQAAVGKSFAIVYTEGCASVSGGVSQSQTRRKSL